MTRVFVVLAVLALALGAAGCGSKKKSATSSTSSSSQTSSSPYSSSTSSSSSSSSSSTATSHSFTSSGNCRHLEQLGVKVSQAVTASGANGSPKAVAKAYADLANAAPAAIRGDLQTLAGALTTYADALAKSGYKAGTTPTAAQIAALQNAAKSFTDPKMQAAEQHLTTWVTTHCTTK